MDISRRHLMIQGALFAATGGCASLIEEASAQAALPERKSLANLPLNDPVMEALRDGVRRMKAAPATDPLRWAALSAIHGTGNVLNRCTHQNWYFLPWHRAYILMYERLIRNLTGFQQFALPYWDWTSNRRLPEAFAQATWGGNANPLHEPSRRMTPTMSLRDEHVGPSVMSSILGAPASEQFGTGRPTGQSSTDPMWLGRQTGAQGVLEHGPHNLVHREVGGHLRTAGSPLDPIFLMHHCNIDRIWTAWRAAGHEDSTEPFWLDMAFQNHFFNVDGSPFSPRVRDVLDPAQLGYSYGAGTPTMSASPSVSALASLVTQVLSGRQQGPGIRTFRIAPPESVAAPAPLQATVPLDATLLAQVVRRPPLPSGMVAADPELRQELAARGARALVILRNIHVAAGEHLYYRVFVDCDYLSASTPITDDHYVGTFGFFASHEGHAGHGGDRPSIVLDLTDALRRVHGSVPVVPGSIRVQVLPVTRDGAAPAAADTTYSRVGSPVATIAVERIEVALVSP